MPLGPHDIESELSEAERLCIQSCFNIVDDWLRRKQFQGGTSVPFEVHLPLMTTRVASQISAAYRKAHWDKVEVVIIPGRSTILRIWHDVPPAPVEDPYA